jgi:short-subunit dehydrogenase
MARLKDRYPGAALVTGASAGIGEAFARRLAAEGFDLALVARRKESLEKLAAELSAKHGVKAHVVAQDLADRDGAARVKAATDALGLSIGLLINNAGYGSWGLFHDLDRDTEANMIDLNCRGTMLMTAAYAPGMVQRKKGGIVITASTAALQPCPFFATYAATKAFDLSFANALWAELKPHGVDVTAICPGYTRTEFQQVAGIHTEFAGTWRMPDQVVDTCLRKLGRGPIAVDGLLNVLGGLGAKFAPRRTVIATAYNVLKRLK